MTDLLLKNIKLIDTENNCNFKNCDLTNCDLTNCDLTNCDLLIKDGIITKIGRVDDCGGVRVVDGMGRLTVMPPVFDMHVHFRDPGFTHKEDIITGCAAALAGGVTGVVCMPNTKPPVDCKEAVDYIIGKALETGVAVYPAACVTKGMDGKEIYDYSELGVKIISDDGRPVENAALMRKALIAAKNKNILVASHCEDLAIIDGGIINNGTVSVELGIKGMDRASEDSVTAREIALAAACDARIHICHVSTVGSVGIIRSAKARGVKVTCETCPHYFMYTDEKLRNMDADYRMNPPLRSETDRMAIAEAVLDGTIDCIVTDHAPHTAEEKADFFKAPNGVVGLETSLAATMTYFYKSGLMSLNKIAEIMCVNPRKLLGIDVPQIKAGQAANLIVVDEMREWTVEPKLLHSKSHNTVFKGEKLTGKCVMTVSDGIIRYDIIN